MIICPYYLVEFSRLLTQVSDQLTTNETGEQNTKFEFCLLVMNFRIQ